MERIIQEFKKINLKIVEGEERNPPTGNLESGSGKNQSVNSLDQDGLVENSIDAPRVGGKRGQVYWTEGSNITLPESTKSAYDLTHED